MKLAQKLATILGILAFSGFILYITRNRSNRSNSQRMLHDIAEEGYETANDVLFPNQKIGAKNLKYGPVLPN